MTNQVEMINGVRTSFGTREAETRLAATLRTSGALKHLVVPMNVAALPEHIPGDVTGSYLPPNAIVTRLFATTPVTAFAGGTSFELKLVNLDGNDIISIADAITLADINAGGELDVDVAVVPNGDPSDKIEDRLAYIEVEATGNFTAGAGALVIEYLEQIDMF
jgi:hypothetical protein